MMAMLGKTLATIGAAWLCLLLALLLFDFVQDAINGQANILFAGWSLADIALLSVPGFVLAWVGTRIKKIF
jgi:hypothetical protein